LGAALFTDFVKGAGFSSMRNHQCADKGRIGIGLWEKQMEGKKTRRFKSAQRLAHQAG
jgi:hypothetical protein